MWEKPNSPLLALKMVKKDTEPRNVGTSRGRQPAKKKKKISVLQPQGTKFCQQFPCAWRWIFPQSLQKGRWSYRHLRFCPCENLSREPSHALLAFWPTKLWDNKLRLFKTMVLLVFCYCNSNRKPKHYLKCSSTLISHIHCLGLSLMACNLWSFSNPQGKQCSPPSGFLSHLVWTFVRLPISLLCTVSNYFHNCSISLYIVSYLVLCLPQTQLHWQRHNK